MTKQSGTERLARFGRNINALGAVAIGGVAAIIPGPNVILTSWAVLNAAQAGGFELWRQHAKAKRQKNQPKPRAKLQGNSVRLQRSATATSASRKPSLAKV